MLIWWREVDWRAVAAYFVTGVPAAALGARTLLVLPPRLIECALGVFFLLMIPARRWLAARGFRLRLPHLVALGAVIGFLTGIVVTTGPITALGSADGVRSYIPTFPRAAPSAIRRRNVGM